MKKLLALFLLITNTSLAQINLNQGLVAYYPFSGNANDLSGNNINGIVSNATLTTDKLGNSNDAYYFNGTNAYISLPYSNLYNFAPQDSFSISVWVLPDQGYTWPAEAVVVKAPFNSDFTLSQWNYGTYIYNYKAMSGYAYNHVLNSSTTLTTNPCWYNIISTYKNGVWKLYVNGILEANDLTQTKFILQDGTSKIFFGKKGESFGDWFKGKMDEVRIYNRVLNQDEINTLVGTCQTQTPCNNWLFNPSFVSSVNVGDLDISGDQITIEALINRTTAWSNNYLFAGDVVSKHSNTGDANYLLRPNNTEITTANGYFTTPPICEIKLNKTYHIAMVYDGKELKFYRNGFLMSKVAATGNLVLNNWMTRIGLYEFQGGNTNFIGYINEVRIWNVARSQLQIQSYMNSSLPSPTTQTGLQAYYIFDNLLNKQGNSAWNGNLVGAAVINSINSSCSFVADSCLILPCTNKTDFSFTRNPCSPYIINFSTSSTLYKSISWDFGDTKTAIGSSTTTHQYFQPGNYQVVMIQDYGNCADTVKKTITVDIQNDNQTILTNDTTICYGKSKQLLSSPALSYCWSPTIFLNNPLAQNPISSATQSITYYLTTESNGSNLIVNGDFSSGNTGFSSDYSYSPSSGFNPGVYTVGNNPVAWHPQMPPCTDHTTGGNGNMMLVNGAEIVNVRVWYQTVAIQPNTNYAFATWIQHLTSTNPANLQFSINGVNIGQVFNASNTSCLWERFYTTWNSGNATTATISIVNKNQIFTGNDFALDDISFSPVYIKRDSIKITVDTPSLNTNPDLAVCAGTQTQLATTGASTYTWSPTTGLSNPNISNPVAAPASTTQYFVTGTNSFGCISKDSVTITVNPKPVITITNDTLLCNNATLQLSASGGASYIWSPVASLNNNLISNPVASPSSNTKYYVTVKDANNCSNTDSVQVDVRSANNFIINPFVDICKNETIQLAASGGDTYNWSPSSSLDKVSVSNPFASPQITTVYSVLITDTVCHNSKTLSTIITVLPPPVLSLTKSNDIDCSNSQSQLKVTGAAIYSWFPSGTLNNPVIYNPIASPVSTTNYIVTGTDLDGCTITDSITVVVTKDNKGGYLMPNAFTPNNDGLNDCFGIHYWGIILELDFSIYNRWGERVFYTSDPSKCWDGTYKSILQNPGVFSYFIKAKTSCESYIFRKGTLSLIK